VLLADSPGPCPGELILERLWLADAVDRISQDVLDEVQNP
jgi:hypothetical protein